MRDRTGDRVGDRKMLEAARVWLWKWRYYQRESLPWRRVALHYELARRGAFARGYLHGEVLDALRCGRLELGEHVLFERGVWIAVPPPARIRIGGGTCLNMGVMVTALELVEIGDHCMFGNGCFISDANHRFADLEVPVPYQGYESKGPTRIGDNVWCGVNVAVLSGVTIGERCVIGSNAVVTSDIPPFSVAVGAPARVIRSIK